MRPEGPSFSHSNRPDYAPNTGSGRTLTYDRQGAADEVLVCGELPTPNAGYGEVRVKLEASGVNPSDTYRRRGPPAMEYPRVITNRETLKKAENATVGTTKALIFHGPESVAPNFSEFS